MEQYIMKNSSKIILCLFLIERIPRELAPRLPPEGRARETMSFSNLEFHRSKDASGANFIEGKLKGLLKSNYNRNRIPRQLAAGRTSFAGLFSHMAFAQGGNYRVQPEDVLSITVYEHDDLKTRARVSTNGEISFPLLEKVKVAG
jgi:hypothetical protein